MLDVTVAVVDVVVADGVAAGTVIILMIMCSTSLLPCVLHILINADI